MGDITENCDRMFAQRTKFVLINMWKNQMEWMDGETERKSYLLMECSVSAQKPE